MPYGVGVRVPLSAQRSLFPRLLFCCPSGAKRGKPTVYHHFAKASTDSPNRKRKDRPKTLGLPELFGQPLSSFISCVTSSRRMIFLPDKASYTSVTCRRLCSSRLPPPDTAKSLVDRIPEHQAESVRLGGNHVLGLYCRKPQRKFDAGRLRKQFQQLVRFMTVVEKRILAHPEFGPDDRFIDFGVGSAMIVSVEKPPIDLFDAYDTIVTLGTLVLLFHNH